MAFTLRSSVVLSSLLVGGVAFAEPPLQGAESVQIRVPRTTVYTLSLDGHFAGVLESAEGGSIVGVVRPGKCQAGDPNGTNGDPNGGGNLPAPSAKRIAGTRYEDITISFGTGMSKALYDWIRDFVAGQGGRHNGAIVAVDYDAKELSRLTFSQALISEVRLPGLDAASTDPAVITLKLAPSGVQLVNFPDGRPSRDASVIAGARKRQLRATNFRFTIGGLGPVAANKFEDLVIKKNVTENPVGEQRAYEKEGAGIEVPNLVITFPERLAKPFYDWHDDFVINGACGESQQKIGAIEFLTSDLKTVLFTIDFHGLGIVKASPDKQEAGTDSGRGRVKVEMYIESMEFKISDGTTFG